jgi:hypothetical protein
MEEWEFQLKIELLRGLGRSRKLKEEEGKLALSEVEVRKEERSASVAMVLHGGI